ncbi:hypothetical protein Sked_14880 [Sanguibacter keddieii DSM 10542]|uniref:Uncharacterized protein n=1 Tax=Sanguibacter keddieii (strain ATCC 51767 / DSM 10542 / NCFB 3025 / ST-74) TaxID=446469 RepID=D1BFR3_SANKS|nr:hypothetical protein [Sanguibacter keddieii]ACZ21424.1 hypothetical protein Sked_14880 [Sanguibacter keddieii DSM 10542]
MTYDAKSPVPGDGRPARPTGIDGLAQLRPAVAIGLAVLGLAFLAFGILQGQLWAGAVGVVLLVDSALLRYLSTRARRAPRADGTCPGKTPGLL